MEEIIIDYNEREFQKISQVFKQEIENKVVLFSDGKIFAIRSWEIGTDTKIIKRGLFKKKSFIEKRFWIKRIYFCSLDTNGEGYWSQKGLVCSGMGVSHLLEARNRYLTMKKYLKAIGGQIKQIENYFES